MKISLKDLKRVLGNGHPVAVSGDASGQYDLAAVVRDAVAQADAAPANNHIIEDVRQLQIDRNHRIAEYNEILAGLFSGEQLYVDDVNRVLGDRAVAVKSRLLSLPSAMARILLGAKRDQAAATIQEKIAEIAAEIPEFDAADFRAREVREGVEEREREDETQSNKGRIR
jgi:hypothetical protein